MAKALNTESSQFTQQVIATYLNNRVSQFSKYLDTTPYFVTYYAVNNAMSRADIGTGSIYEELGPTSPLRFNKITGFPIYIGNPFQPNTLLEEGRIDIEIELNDVTILPSTIVPKPYDFICIEVPGSPKMLFRVNNMKFTSIQSNDYYQIDMDLRRSGDSCVDDIEKQVVERYKCVFDNIGTQNNCFINLDDSNTVDKLSSMMKSLSDFYHDVYYDDKVGTYVYTDLKADSVRWAEPPANFQRYIYYGPTGGVYGPDNSYIQRMMNPPPPPVPDSTSFYDIFMMKFIIDSELFYEPSDVLHVSNLNYDDLLPENFDWLYRQSIWYALHTKDTTYLKRYPQYLNHEITRMYSPLRLRLPHAIGVSLIMHLDHMVEHLLPYISQTLVAMILDYESNKNTNDNKKHVPSIADAELINIHPVPLNGEILKTNPISPNEYKPERPKSSDSEYDLPEYKNTINYIFNYITGAAISVDESEMIKELIVPSQLSYWLVPMVLYIMDITYNNYFRAIS